jgi:hypothetical protein
MESQGFNTQAKKPCGRMVWFIFQILHVRAGHFGDGARELGPQQGDRNLSSLRDSRIPQVYSCNESSKEDQMMDEEYPEKTEATQDTNKELTKDEKLKLKEAIQSTLHVTAERKAQVTLSTARNWKEWTDA